MSDSIPPQAVRKLPVWDCIRKAHACVLGQPVLLLKAMVSPCLVFILLSSVWGQLMRLDGSGDGGLSSVARFFLIHLPFYTYFGVAWHRLTLLGNEMGRPLLLPRLRRRHFEFFALSVVVSLVVLLASYLAEQIGELNLVGLARELASQELPFAGIAALFGYLLLLNSLFLGVPYLIFRFSFVFPAAAVDEPYGLTHSWRHTRNQGLRLLLVGVAVGLPILLFSMGLKAVVFQLQAADGTPLVSSKYFGSLLIWRLIQVILHFMTIALVVSAISLAFKACTGWVPAKNQPR